MLEGGRRGPLRASSRAGSRDDAIKALPPLTGSQVACHAMYGLDEAS
jgi:hypothetical protein